MSDRRPKGTPPFTPTHVAHDGKVYRVTRPFMIAVFTSSTDGSVGETYLACSWHRDGRKPIRCREVKPR